MKRLTILAVVCLATPLLFAQEPKNVQLLKGLTPTQLQRTMNMMRGALGVHCDFCHVFQNDKWDFASDDKKEKQIARDMIRMTMDLNEKYFKATAVSCNSCHRGSLQPVALVALPQAAPPFPTPPIEHPPLPSRDEVVAKYSAALGRVDAKAVSSIELIGTRESPTRGSAPFDVLIAPGKMRVTSKTQTGEIVNVLDNGSGWISDERGARVMNPSQVEHTTQLTDLVRFILPGDIPADAKVTGKEKVGDKDAWVLTMPFGSTGQQRLYFDTPTGLLLKRVTLLKTAIGFVPQQATYEDYRDAGGIKLPHTVRFDSVDPWIGSTRRYSEIRLNAKIDDSVFKQPAPQ